MVKQDQVISIIAEALGVEESNIKLDTKSHDLPEWDSLGHLSILSKISEKLGDAYDESQELASASSVEEVLNSLNK